MEYDKDKVDEMILALLNITTFKDEYGFRAWKGMDWDVLYRSTIKDTLAVPKAKEGQWL